jgi:predicted DNA-binding transcriptional regulator AlpA
MYQEEVVVGIRQAANYLGISAKSIQRLLKSGEFPQSLPSDGRLKGTLIWRKIALDEVKNSLRKRGQRRTEQKVRELEQRVALLENENRELHQKIGPISFLNLFPEIKAKLNREQILELTKKLADDLGMKLVQAVATSARKSLACESSDWEELREVLKKEAERKGGNRALARELGMTESAIRRFIKGEYKTLSSENVAKIRQALKPA